MGGYHSIVKIRTIVYDDPLRDAIPTNEIFLYEMGNNILGNRGERSYLHPLCKIVNGH